MKVYLAARYGRLEEMRNYRTQLQELGFEVTSRWLNGEHQIAHDGHPLGANREALVESQEERDIELKAHFASEDLLDLLRSDLMIAFTEPPNVVGRGRGGRHIEFGVALAWETPIIVVGPRENVFYCLPAIRVTESFAQAIELINKDGSPM